MIKYFKSIGTSNLKQTPNSHFSVNPIRLISLVPCTVQTGRSVSNVSVPRFKNCSRIPLAPVTLPSAGGVAIRVRFRWHVSPAISLIVAVGTWLISRDETTGPAGRVAPANQGDGFYAAVTADLWMGLGNYGGRVFIMMRDCMRLSHRYQSWCCSHEWKFTLELE